MSVTVHLLIEDPEGPIPSGEHVAGDYVIGKNARLRAACDPKIVLGEGDRGTGEPWAVHCDACKKTNAFKQLSRPKPTLVEELPVFFYKEDIDKQNPARQPEQTLSMLSELLPRLALRIRDRHVRVVYGDKPSVCPNAILHRAVRPELHTVLLHMLVESWRKRHGLPQGKTVHLIGEGFCTCGKRPSARGPADTSKDTRKKGKKTGPRRLKEFIRDCREIKRRVKRQRVTRAEAAMEYKHGDEKAASSLLRKIRRHLQIFDTA